MKESFDINNVVKSLNSAISLLEEGGSRLELSNMILDTIGEGVCDLHCLTSNPPLFQIILDMIPVPVYYKDIYGVYKGCNDALAELYGRHKEDIIGRTVFDIFSSEEAEMLSCSDTVLMNEAKNEIIEHKGKFTAMGGNYHILHKKLITTSIGNVVGVLGIVVDVTPQKLSEERAWQGEAFYKSLFEQSPRPCVIFDSFNMISDMNYAAVEFFDLGSEYVGRDIAEIFSSHEDFEKLMNSAGNPVRVNIHGVAKDSAVEAVASLTVCSASEVPTYAVSFILMDSIT